MSYTKLFQSIITSTIWNEDDRTRIVWITMLAMADKNGEVQGSVPGLARIAGVPLEACETALAKFMAPDPYSRTPDDEGRRIETIPGGWSLLNHRKYREMASKVDSQNANAERQRRHRAKLARNEKNPQKVSRNRNATVTHDRDIAEADTEADPCSFKKEPKQEENPPSADLELESTPPPPPKKSVKSGSKRELVESDIRSADSLLLPLDLRSDGFPEAWDQWKAHRADLYRRDSKAIWNERSAKMIIHQCAQHGTALAVMAITAAVSNGWRGLFWDRLQPASKTAGTNGNHPMRQHHPEQTFKPLKEL